MWASGVVKGQISAGPNSSLGHGLVGVDRPPGGLDEDIVAPCASAIYQDFNPGLLQHGSEVDGGELRTLIGVEDVGLAMPGKRFIDRLDTECNPAALAVAAQSAEIGTQPIDCGSRAAVAQ